MIGPLFIDAIFNCAGAFGSCFVVVQHLVSFLVLQSEKAGCFTLNVSQLSCGC